MGKKVRKMLADLNKTTELVNLATEACKDYQTVRLKPDAKASLVHYRRDLMERALLALHEQLHKEWPRFYETMMGAIGVPEFEDGRTKDARRGKD